MSARSALVTGALVMAAVSGCAIGIGPPSAADHAAGRGLARFTASSDQRGVPSGWVRGRWTVFDQWKSPIGLHAGNRKGWLRGGLAGRDATGGDVTDMHWDLTVPLGKGLAVGLSYLWATTTMEYSDGVSLAHDGTGWAGRASYAPHPNASLDLLVGKVSGTLTVGSQENEKMDDVGVSRLALGVTVRPVPILALRLDVVRVSGEATVFGRSSTWGGWGPSVEAVLCLF